MDREQKNQIPDDRPAFHVDKILKEAGKRAAKAFEEEEKDLAKAQYENFWK